MAQTSRSWNAEKAMSKAEVTQIQSCGGHIPISVGICFGGKDTFKACTSLTNNFEWYREEERLGGS